MDELSGLQATLAGFDAMRPIIVESPSSASLLRMLLIGARSRYHRGLRCIPLATQAFNGELGCPLENRLSGPRDFDVFRWCRLRARKRAASLKRGCRVRDLDRIGESPRAKASGLIEALLRETQLTGYVVSPRAKASGLIEACSRTLGAVATRAVSARESERPH